MIVSSNIFVIIVSVLVCLLQSRDVESFTTAPIRFRNKWDVLRAENNPVDELSDERKANLFQFLLRDLEVEGVPLLEVDSDRAHTFQAAMYTVMSQLSQQDEEGKACLVLQDMPIESLADFVEDFATRKADGHLAELQRFNVTLVGRGVGPAIVLETSERTDAEVQAYDSFQASYPIPEEFECTAMMKTFVAKTMSEEESGPVAYRIAGATDICDTLATFWSCICELLSSSELSSTVLSFPPIPIERFSIVADIISKSFFSSRGQDLFELRYLVPESESANDLLALENYESGSPFPGIVIKRL